MLLISDQINLLLSILIVIGFWHKSTYNICQMCTSCLIFVPFLPELEQSQEKDCEKENKDNAVLTTYERKCSAVGWEVGQKPDLSALTSSLIALSQITDKQIILDSLLK